MFEHIETKLKDMVTEDSETGRVYKTPEGIDLPSITTVLSILSRAGIAAWRKRVGEEEANRISTQLHLVEVLRFTKSLRSILTM